MENNSTPPIDAPPVAEASDYISIGVLTAMLCIGGPLNLLSLLRFLGVDIKGVFTKCLRRKSNNHDGLAPERRRPRRTKLTLNFHLTVANMLILWVYVLSEVCWRLTYQWLGGDVLCRLIRFIHMFCFYATSNLVATIALDRLYIAVRIDRPNGAAGRANAVRWFANCAWTLALICSLPQLFVWRTFEPFPGWEQCVTIWAVSRYNATLVNGTTVIGSSTSENSSTGEPNTEADNYHERLYNGLHLLFVFWLPVFLIIVCYALIVTRFHRDISKSKRSALEAAVASGGEPSSQHASPAIHQPTVATVRSRTPRIRAPWPCSPSKSNMQHHRPADTLELTVDTSICYTANSSVGMIKSDSTAASLKTKSVHWCCYGRHTNQASDDRMSKANSSQAVSGAVGISATAVGQPSATTAGGEMLAPANHLGHALVGAGQPLLPKNFAASTLMRAKRRTVKKSFWILLAYFVCWSPYNVINLWIYVNPNFYQNQSFYLDILSDLIVLNAVVNPLIYGI